MRQIVLLPFLAVIFNPAIAGESAFTKGPVFENHGPVANVTVTMAIPQGTVLKHSFDTSTPASEGGVNRTLESAARFINMHARAGVTLDNIHVAVVMHGKTVMEVADEKSASADLIEALIDKGVRIIVCGQSAAYYDVATDDLLPGVEMALSAMTAHALLQQQGYTLNPF